MRESQVENYLVEQVKMLGGEVRKVRWIGRNGAPDRLVMLPEQPGKTTTVDAVRAYRDEHCCTMLDAKRALTTPSRPPRALWVELKAPGEKAKPHQQREHDRMRRMGQVVVVVDSFEAVDTVLA
ncbi:VRR-NUC domain-containing protein [Bordetella hinzii]|uniref:VRR-NUC domain-containing protein n=1 Tax=Bordetella hinzii TaxID=103855 RepID=UPI0013EFC5E5|nr:VRR-NUC domain-containing protein [Bordetella hinzii]QII84231.1 VRR-NUC domain-containing protein [Bordetella hinzii]